MTKICRIPKRFFNYDTSFSPFRQETEYLGPVAWATGPYKGELFLFKGHTVGALVHGGVGLMGTHHDPLQRAVVLSVAVVSALGNGAFDALVGMTVHIHFLLYFGLL